MKPAGCPEKSFPLQRRILSDDVVEYLIDMILNGAIKPGGKIVELQVAHVLNVSQATVREALKELEVRGFLESRPFRGTYVRKFTVEGIQDYFRTRTELEVLAAAWASENGFRHMDRPGMEGCLDEMAKYLNQEDHVLFRKKDMEFHQTLVHGAGSEALLSAWKALSHSYWAYFGLHFEQMRYNLKDQMEKHKAIYRILLTGDSAALKKALQDHYVDIRLIEEKKD